MTAHAPLRLGRYQLLERLAVGGMAEVWRALALGLSGFEKMVVVKRLLPQHHRDQEVLTMFVDEARLLARLRHDNIAEVYDIDNEGDEYFFALEFVDGVDLRALVDATSTPIGLQESLWLVHEVARALAHAHALQDDRGRRMGIVHRDVSPSNVLVDRTGRVKLVDFGVAKWLAQRSETRHGVLKGKVNYMSPEQCRGEPLDQRTDVFALGVLLYELTVGERPFARSSDFETLKAIAEGHFIAPCVRKSEYPRGLETIVMAALELDVARRTPDMPTLIEQLATFARTASLTLAPGDLPAHVERVAGVARPQPVAATLPQPSSRLAAGFKHPADGAERTETAATISATPVAARPPVAAAPRVGRRVPIVAGAGALCLAAAVWLTRGQDSKRPVGGPATTGDTAASSLRVAQPPVGGSTSAVEALAHPASPPAPASPEPTFTGTPPPRRAPAVRAATPAKPMPASPSPAPVAADRVAPAATPPALWDPDSPVPP